ncbi:uncharacterized protein [Physcomitrium patens]|uniref:DEAD/DEAH-box helicase domain-containing protein n=1 Tax=Physcomitrium patens TaxID=3218 RepID=A0A2K1IGQ3_PHYPA|nr:uncharacterized protein LOC112276430 [Physcomitrium patens]PNR28456.1 hypothetical protein PHYPA_029048 [Physcomitrium patens]|eukprot:XP_024363492.1 uncharacterized protein LOC112276430 [Physcomitrella patens]
MAQSEMTTISDETQEELEQGLPNIEKQFQWEWELRITQESWGQEIWQQELRAWQLFQLREQALREQKSQELRKIQGVCEWKKRSMRKKQYVTREVELSEMLEAYERKWYHRPLYGKDAEKHFPKTTDVPSHPKQWNMVPPVQSPSLPPSSSFRSPTLFMSEEIPDSNSPAGKGSGKTTPAVIAALDQVDRKVHVPQTLILCPKTENVNECMDMLSGNENSIGVTSCIAGTSTFREGIKAQVVVGTPGDVKRSISVHKTFDTIHLNKVIFLEPMTFLRWMDIWTIPSGL